MYTASRGIFYRCFDLESEILVEMNKRIVADFLDMLILLKLRNGSLNGYDTVSYIRKRFNTLISSGTVYSCLCRLERDELIKEEGSERKRVFTLTQKGEERVKTLLSMRDKILGLVVNLFIG